jgi:alkyldihydroxyacetonephosphate synthase
VLRLYDEAESQRNFELENTCALIVLDEGEQALVDGVMSIVGEECSAVDPLDDGLVEQWLGHRNDVSALEALISRGLVVDTMEISGPWRALPQIYTDTIAAISGVEHTMAASAHQSHSYLDGGCLYFTFAGRPPPDERETYYRAVWDAGQRAVLAADGALSHHHGVGLNRARFVSDALGEGFGVLQAIKDALDPNGILNPGKLGLRNPFGDLSWP